MVRDRGYRKWQSNPDAGGKNGDLQALGVGLWALWVNTITQGRVADSLEWANRMLVEGDQRRDNDS